MFLLDFMANHLSIAIYYNDIIIIYFNKAVMGQGSPSVIRINYLWSTDQSIWQKLSRYFIVTEKQSA